MKSTRLLLLFILSLTLVSCGSNDLVRKGSSDYQIKIFDSDSDYQKQAAKLLQEYVEKITGLELPIIDQDNEDTGKLIIIKNAEDLHPDGYRLAVEENGFVITGGAHKGCIYGVVELLEREWGCRLYSPTYEVVPKRKSLQLPIKLIEDYPKNNFRIINGQFSRNPQFQDWHKLDLTQDQFAKGYYVHTFNRLIPWEDNFDDHPEYYSEVDGRRIKDQLCLTNPDVLKLTIAKLKGEMSLQPEKQLWSVSQGDNFTYCQCDECMKIIKEEGSPSGPIIRFVNQIADIFPDKIISTLAYQYSRKAPKKVVPRKNIQVMLCTIELNRSQSIADDQTSQSFLTDIEEWGAIANHIYLWDYTVNFSHHISPFPNIHVLQANILLFTNNNIHEHFQQSNTDTGHEFSELKSYLISRLLWNPDVNVDSLIMDFTDGFYGEAAPLIRKYLKAIEEDVKSSKERLDIYGHPTAHENTFLDEDKVNEYLKLFSEARQLVVNDSARLIHVRTAQLPLQYAAMEIGKNHMFDSRGWYTDYENNYVPRSDMLNMLEDFIATCRVAGVNTINESGLKPEDYYSATQRFIAIQVEGNLAFRKTISAREAPSKSYSSGELTYLLNGVQGASDYKVHWLGWEAQDFELTVDLEDSKIINSVEIGSLYDPKSWIFHPKSVECQVSVNGLDYSSIGKLFVKGDQRKEAVTRNHSFDISMKPVRFIKILVKGTHENPRWHASAGGKSWVFIDEIVVR